MNRRESSLPRYAPAAPTAGIDGVPDHPGSPPVMLVVDAQAAERDLYCMVMKMLGARTMAAADGWEALVCARTLLPDLVITDLRLPGLDGPELVERLRADPRTACIPIVLITGANPWKIDRHTRAAAAAVLPKPLDLRALEEAVHDAVGCRMAGTMARAGG